jgi:glutathione S-transferase
MQLIYAKASPFARKVRVAASEVGLSSQIELIDTVVMPIIINEKVNALNPLGKIPILLTNDGEVLFDSHVICEYLDSLHNKSRLIPSAGSVRWHTLSLNALADGLMEAALLVRYEQAIRPEKHQWDEWIEGQMSKVHRALTALENKINDSDKVISIAHISIACALGYLDFRFISFDWRSSHLKLAKFQESFAARASMMDTLPV